ncbi:MAG: GntR family transcriptional regulator [Epulopiscium sp. Nuni2H_MBin003]|nr:MAG: GntR family transcriptional regulator [Epulopiscium sp. Nuni2H_MBin003]
MPWEFDNDKPIYTQLVNIFKLKIISATLKPAEKLSSVRELAQIAGVNPNTMQRALSELEHEKLVYSNRTAGRFVTEDENLIANIRETYAKNYITELVSSLLKIGLSTEEILALIEQELKKTSR